MPVVKNQTASALLKEAIVLDLGDLGRQAARMQAAAEAKARQIIADAESQAARLIEESRARGLAEGRAQGLENGLAEGRKQGHAEALQQSQPQLQQIQQAWINAAKEWDLHREALEREGRQDVLDMALALSEKLVHRVLEIDPTVVVDQVGQALAYVLKPLDVTIRICPQDRPAMDEALPQLVAEFANLKHVRLVDDPSISRGGCIVSYGQGQVDASLETQLRRIVELMLPDPQGQGSAASDTTDHDTHGQS